MGPSDCLWLSKTLMSPRCAVNLSCCQVGKGKLQAAASHRNQKCEFEPVNLFIVSSKRVNSFREEFTEGGFIFSIQMWLRTH